MITVLLGMFIYAVIHSFLAGLTVKRFIHKRFGERVYYGLYRVAYNAVATIAIVPVLLLVYLRSETTVWHVSSQWQPLLLLIQAIGLAGLLLALLQIDLWRFAGLSELRAFFAGDPLPLPPEPLQIRGVYAFVRHPLYLFSLLVLWPVTSMTDTLLAFNVVTTLYFIFGSLLEERRMKATFGPLYIDYQKRVPWLIPIPRKGH